MINISSFPVARPGMNVHDDARIDGQGAAECNQQQAACDAIETRGEWNNQYMDLVVPSLTQLCVWPKEKGLIVVEDGRAERYEAGSSHSIAIENIDYEKNIVLNRVGGNHYNVLTPGGEQEMPKDGDCLFRAVITGWHHGRVDDALAEDGYISELRDRVSIHVSRNWETLQHYVVSDPQAAAPAPRPRQNSLSDRASLSEFWDAESPLNWLMDDILNIPLANRSATLLEPHLLAALLAPAINPVHAAVVTAKELQVCVTALSQLNEALIQNPAAFRAEQSERCMQVVFVGEGGHPPSMAESILNHRHLPAFKTVVDKLMDLMENVADQLPGEALEHFASVLGVNIRVDEEDWGMAQDFATRPASSQAMIDFAQRFDELRDRFGISF